MIARQLLFSGRVQGVSFRAAIKRIASGFEVTGWVKNLDDGRVEMQAMCYDSEEMDEFLAAIEDSDLAGYVKDREVHVIAPLPGVRGFNIVR